MKRPLADLELLVAPGGEEGRLGERLEVASGQAGLAIGPRQQVVRLLPGVAAERVASCGEGVGDLGDGRDELVGHGRIVPLPRWLSRGPRETGLDVADEVSRDSSGLGQLARTHGPHGGTGPSGPCR